MIDVRALRARLGLTQAELAARVGVGRRIVVAWEQGDHTPKGARLDRLVELDAPAPVVVVPEPAAAPVVVAPPVVELDPGRRIMRLGEAVRSMGLKDEGHGRRSDHTIRKAIKLGRLHAWKAPGYRPQYAEWCFYADDFETWRASHYQAHRDPRVAASKARRAKLHTETAHGPAVAVRLRKKVHI